MARASRKRRAVGKQEGAAAQPRLARDVHRRILEKLNAARRPEDLAALELDEPKSKQPKIAREIIELRDRHGPFGFTHLDQIKDLVRLRGDILDLLIRFFSRTFYGQWTMTPYDTRLPNGTAYHVAHAAMLKTGKVLFLPEATLKTTLLWDPADLVNPQFEFMEGQPDEYLFCSGHSFMSDGRLLVVGGGGGGPSGVNRAWKFDPTAPAGSRWTKTTGDMTHARWYPTVVTLGDERRILAVGGAPSNNTAEVYDEYSDGFTLLTGPASTRSFPQLYPGLHLLPGGQVFYSRTGFGSAGPGPGGAGDPLPTSAFLQYTVPSTGAWTEIADIMEFPDRVRGMSVLLVGADPHCVKLLVIGGTSSPGSQTAQIINLATVTPIWEMPMDVPGGAARNNVNAVLLPDGTVFVCGGTVDTNVPCALYSPDTGMWSEMAHLNYRKQYHSVALLLPSGQVMATGGSNYGGGSNVIEIFSPPYLFWGARPTIDTCPAMVHHAQNFQIQSPQAADIEKVVLVRPMAVTHQTDSEQRVVQMSFTQSGNTLHLTAPNGSHPHHTPRGHYMLFLLNGSGIPSVGRFMFLH